MKLENLYDLAEKENIKIYDWHIEDAEGIFINIDKINAIALNYDEIGTYIEEKQTLAEELGHYYYDAYYSLSSSRENIEKQEYKALKWKSLVCVPLQSILNCFYKRYI